MPFKVFQNFLFVIFILTKSISSLSCSDDNAAETKSFCFLSSIEKCQGQAHKYTAVSQADGPFSDIPPRSKKDVWYLSEHDRLIFVDIDNDNDFDAVLSSYRTTCRGESVSQCTAAQLADWNIKPQKLRVLLNVGSRSNPKFELMSTENSSIIFPDARLNNKSFPWAQAAFGDIDGDGFQDMIIGAEYRQLIFFRNMGNGTFLDISTSTKRITGSEDIGMWTNIMLILSTSSNPNGNPQPGERAYFTPALVDIDNDSDLDLVVGAGNGRFHYFKNQGNMTHASFVYKPDKKTIIDNPFYNNMVASYGNPTFIDHDGDGDLDMITGQFTGDVRYFENIGSASSPKLIIRTLESSPMQYNDKYLDFGYISRVSAVDLDDDGDSDLVSIGSLDGVTGDFQILLLLNILDKSKPIIFSEISIPSDNPFDAVRERNGGTAASPALVDIDGDGDVDAICGTFVGWLKFYKNRKADNGNTGSKDITSNVFELVSETDATSPLFGISDYLQSLYESKVPNRYYISPGFADVDADGDLDLFLGFGFGNAMPYRLTLLTNCGTAKKAQYIGCKEALLIDNFKMSYPTPKGVDIDNDGDFDIVVGGRNGNFIYIPNLGNSTHSDYQLLHTYGGTPPPWLINCYSDWHCLAENGVMIDAKDHSNPSFLDFDLDGDYDMVSGEESGKDKYYRNEGTATVPSFKTVDDSSNPFATSNRAFWQTGAMSYSTFDFADLDNDGIPEMIMSCNFKGSGRWRLFKMLAGLCTKEENACSGVTSCPSTTGQCACPFGYRGSKHCATCEVGYFYTEDSVNTESFDCLACSPGFFLAKNNHFLGACNACDPGQFQPDRYASTCRLCPEGWYQETGYQTFCFPCSPGKYNSEKSQTGCKSCSKGRYRNADDASTLCKSCINGTYQDREMQALCIPCSPGRHSSNDGSVVCEECPAGQFQDLPQQSKCRNVQNGSIVADGGSAAIEVPLGSKIICNQTTKKCSTFLACEAGTFGKNPATEQCMLCPAGWSSTKASILCNPCSKGKYSDELGIACKECDKNSFQEQNDIPSIECVNCPIGWKQDAFGQSLCSNLNWQNIDSCSDNEYLNTSSGMSHQDAWKCIGCPQGGDCTGATTSSNLVPKLGWWKIPLLERDISLSNGDKGMFAKCFYIPACLGKLRTLNTSNTTGACDVSNGYRNNSRLCHTCKKGFRRIGLNQCGKCPEAQGTNWALLILGVIVLVGVLMFMAGTAISAAGEQKLSEAVQKILLNYLQVATMAKSFPLRWPKSIEGLFEFQGAFSTVGDHLANPDCISYDTTAAELLYNKQIVFAFMPLLTVVFAFLFWYLYGLVKGISFFEKRDKPGDTTIKDKFIVTVGALLYLVFPTLVGNAFKLFDCRRVGKKTYLYSAMEEECYVDRHLTMTIILGGGQLFLYVIGLPLLLLLFLIHNHDRLDRHAVQARYGLFYASYKKERFYWEVILMIRKISIVALGVFGPIFGTLRQAQLALLILLICIIIEIIFLPYDIPTGRHKILPRLEGAALCVEWITMWSGIMMYSSLDLPDHNSSVVFFTILVVLSNGGMMMSLVYCLLRECCQENEINDKILMGVTRVSSFRLRNRTVEMVQWQPDNPAFVETKSTDQDQMQAL